MRLVTAALALVLCSSVVLSQITPWRRADRGLGNIVSDLQDSLNPENFRPNSRARRSTNSSSQCPPQSFTSAPVDLKQYVAAPWYPQKQEVVAYQPESELFCVRAIYQPLDPNNITAGLAVLNYANRGEVNGPPVGSGLLGSLFKMYASLEVPDSPNDTGKLLVFPGAGGGTFPSTPSVARGVGEYWIVALGQYANQTDSPSIYEWAIISAGAPKRESPSGGCLTGSRDGAYDAGLWLFSRKPVDPDNTAIMEKKAQELGFDTSRLKNVTQEGCKYEGA